MPQNFFSLEGTAQSINEDEFFKAVATRGVTVRDCQYDPQFLKSRISPRKWLVHEVIFENVSFSQTSVEEFEFNNCKFIRCLFIGTLFRDCRFSNCAFIDSNPFRIEFQNVYVEPLSFRKCVKEIRYANIGVHLYQELLRNSRAQSQPDFTDDAHYEFRRWQRHLLRYEIRSMKGLSPRRVGKIARLTGSWIFALIAGSGVRLSNLVIFSLTTLCLVSAFNWCFRAQLGLSDNAGVIKSVIEAFYFSAITITTVGFGDVTPTTSVGRLAISFEAMIGFVLLAILTSTIYRRISS